MSLDIRECLRGLPAQTRYTYRFNGCRTAHRESIAEHSYFTTLYSMLVADWVHNHTSIEINVEEVMRRGVLHDVEEVVTGDFPRPFKHGSGPEFAVAVEAASSKVCVDVMRSFTFDNDQAWYYHSIWERAKDDSYEGRVFAFADFLSAISFIVQEIESGNRMQSHIGTIQNYVQIFRSPEYEFIESLVRQVEGLLREVLV